MTDDQPEACPNCGAETKWIVWGLLTEDPGPDYVMGGCVLPVGDVPSLRCPDCGWSGGAR